MNEIIPGIFMWSRLSEPHGYNFNGHLVEHEDDNICVDPVAPDAATLEEIVEKGVTQIVLTNRNHTRGANEVRARTGAPVSIHTDDAAHARTQGTEIDAELVVGEHVGPFEIVDASGKSPGEVALFWRQRRILIVGDVLIGSPKGRCALLPDDKMDDPARLRDSVRRLYGLYFETLLMGDGAPIRHDARIPLAALISTLGNPTAA